jgi:intracellular septation protein A
MEVCRCAGASTKAIIFSANQVSYCFAPQTKIAQAQTTSTKAIIFFSQSVCPFNESDFFQPIGCPTVMRCFISVHLVIPDWNHGTSGHIC